MASSIEQFMDETHEFQSNFEEIQCSDSEEESPIYSKKRPHSSHKKVSLKIKKEAPVFKIIRKKHFEYETRGGKVNSLKSLQPKRRYIPKLSGNGIIKNIIDKLGHKRDFKKKQDVLKMKALVKKRKKL